MGLHHFTPAGLDVFLADVRRVLKDGGHFLLVDHDVVDEQSMAMAHMAHMSFNAVYGETVANEMSEVRLFRPMSEWRKKLAEFGLADAVEGPDVPMIRQGDPSKNRMVRFDKKPQRPQLAAVAAAGAVSDRLDDSPPVTIDFAASGRGRVSPSVEDVFGYGKTYSARGVN